MSAIAQIFGRWSALPRWLRIAGGAVASLALTVSVAASIVRHQPRTPLFPMALHAEQLVEVEQRLAEWDVPFTPTADNVVIDTGRRNDLMLRLALAGVPHAHLASTGEALATIGVLTPQSVIEAQTRAGLAGDIEAGLRGIDGVDDARVIVAPARPAEFADESPHEAQASVRLRLRPGVTLSRPAISGIRAFVAASVPELSPSRVTILDDRGVALGEDPGAPDDVVDLQRSLQSALDFAFGEGAAIVRVRAEYEAAGTAQRDVRRMPTGVSAIQQTRRTEAYDDGAKRYRRLEEGLDRGSHTVESLSQIPAGALKRLSAAVFVDQNRSLDLAKVRELAAAALGYDAKRGDTLAVEAIDFHRTPVARKDGWWLLYSTIVALAPAIILAIGFVACARLVVPPAVALAKSIMDRAAVQRAARTATAFPPARVRSMLEQEPPHAAAAVISALPAATATAVLELYPPHEREAIVHRMQRRNTPLFCDADELLRRHV